MGFPCSVNAPYHLMMAAWRRFTSDANADTAADGFGAEMSMFNGFEGQTIASGTGNNG
jgi:hypothetical protein